MIPCLLCKAGIIDSIPCDTKKLKYLTCAFRDHSYLYLTNIFEIPSPVLLVCSLSLRLSHVIVLCYACLVLSRAYVGMCIGELMGHSFNNGTHLSLDTPCSPNCFTFARYFVQRLS